MSAQNDAIVVGVGADGSESALRFAVAEGRRTGRPVHLVHVLQLPRAMRTSACTAAPWRRPATPWTAPWRWPSSSRPATSP